MKTAYYFSHDYNARNDPKLQSVLMQMGQEGIGLFWCLIELMYEEDGKLNLSDCESYAFTMRTTKEKIHQLIKLAFKSDKQQFWNESVLRRLKLRKQKSQKAKKSAEIRWSKNANALRSECDRNAIKERKGKENKYTLKNWKKFNEKFNSKKN